VTQFSYYSYPRGHFYTAYCIPLDEDNMKISGSLGGLQMLNLTSEGRDHPRVLSCGQDPLVDPTYDPFWSCSDSNQRLPEVFDETASALTFCFEKSLISTEVSDFAPSLSLKMASVIYTHSPSFLLDLKYCINQFQTPLATKLKSAAAQIALGLVRQDAIPGLNNSTYNFQSPIASISNSLDRLDYEPSWDTGNACYPVNRPGHPTINLNIVLESPVIVLPKTNSSPDVLVAHLGQITITGTNKPIREEILNPEGERIPQCSVPNGLEISPNGVSYNVFVCDVSLYSLNLRKRWSMMENLKMTYPYPASYSAPLMRTQDLYNCDPVHAIPILHNTVIQLTVTYLDEDDGDPEDGDTFHDAPFELLRRLDVQGRVVNPLKVSVTPGQYSQIFESLNNIAIQFDDGTPTGEVDVSERRVKWQKHLKSLGKNVDAAPLPSPTKNVDDFLPIFVIFEIPELILQLVLPERNEFEDHEDNPRLSLSCSDLSFKCEKEAYLMDMNVSLKSLTLEDTSVPLESRRRVLAMSKNNESSPKKGEVSSLFHRTDHCSNSCPDLARTEAINIPNQRLLEPATLFRSESTSLPEDLDPSFIFTGRLLQANTSGPKKRKSSMYNAWGPKSTACPNTPPPSPRPEETCTSYNLVQLQIVLVDQKNPHFVQKYNGTHKIVHVDFNALEVLLTPDTFTYLRKFFSDVGKIEEDLKNYETNPHISLDPGETDEDITDPPDNRNTETQINVNSLCIKFARSKGNLAEAIVSSVKCDFKTRGKNYFGVDGRLGSLEIQDISAYSGRYPVKFTFQGKQALDFDYVRKGMK